MTGTGNELAVREAYVITPAERAAAAADAGLDSWLIVMKDVVLLAEHICNTSFVPKAYRGNAPATAAAILTGRELGIPPMTALRHVQVVEGVPSLDAEYKRARVLAAGHELDIIEWDNEKCVMSGRRRGSNKPPLVVEYSMRDARIAGLVREGGNYVKRPRVMTLARATTLITNAIFADVTNGLATAELLANGDEDVIADYAGTGPDIPGLRPERPRVTAADARARAPQAVTATVVTPEPSPAGTETPRSAPPAESPAGVPPAGEASRRPQQASTGQVGMIQRQFERLGMGGGDQRDGRLRVVSAIAGRPLASSKELSDDEARKVRDTLEGLKDGADLDGLLAEIALADDPREDGEPGGE